MTQAYDAAVRYVGNIANSASYRRGLSTIGRVAMATELGNTQSETSSRERANAILARLNNRGYARATYAGVRGAGGSGR